MAAIDRFLRDQLILRTGRDSELGGEHAVAETDVAPEGARGQQEPPAAPRWQTYRPLGEADGAGVGAPPPAEPA